MRELLRDAFARACAGVDLEGRVRRALPRPPRAARAVAIVAIGKAAPAMARGALAALHEWPAGTESAAAAAAGARVLVVAPDGVEIGRALDDPRVELRRAAHPDPDRRSVAAARRALERVAASDFVLALVSGGASSLVCLPRGISLARYVRVTRMLTMAGATVREVNVVRRHMCAVKGGGLARAAGGPVVTLIASDVIGGALHDIGSGPTVPDPTTARQAREVLRRFVPRLAVPRLHESLAPTSAAARRLRARFVARPQDLARAMATELRARGLVVRVLRSSLAPAEALAREYVARSRALGPGEALVRAAEPSLRIHARSPGRGGRSTHLAALLAADLPPGVVFLAGASDGVDGASGTAGAVVDGSLGRHAPLCGVARALAAFDTAPLLAAAGMVLAGAPTGTNLADVHVLARA